MEGTKKGVMALAKRTREDVGQMLATSSVSVISVVAIIVALGLATLVGFGFDKIKQNKNQKTEPAVAAVSAVAYDGQEGKNALEILKTKAEVETQDSSIGIFITSINGVANSDNQYWMFYVNGELGAVAADQYQTKNDDKIEWRYETFK